MRRTVVFVGLLLATGCLALALRLPRLNLRPMHVDEAVHAVKFDTLWRTGLYKYDLNEYHGPTLYYATLPAASRSTASVRGTRSDRTCRGRSARACRT